MVRIFALGCSLLLLLTGLLIPAARAGDDPKAGAPLVLASDEEVAALLEQFKEDWKAKGLSGDDKLMQRDFAMRQISKAQHPEILKSLGKVAKSGDGDLRMLAVIYLSDQKALPHLAAGHILGAMKRDKKDIVMQITALQALGDLKYLGASAEIRAQFKHQEFVVRKSAIAAVGTIGDMRLLGDVLGILGVKIEKDGGKEADKKDGAKEVVEEGYSWDGVDVTYDTGTSGDGDQQMAEKIGKEKLAQNKAAAESGRSGGGGINGSAGGMGGAGGRGGSSRSTEELVPAILLTLKKLTGEAFDKPSSIRKWVRDNQPQLDEACKALDAKEKAQKSNKG